MKLKAFIYFTLISVVLKSQSNSLDEKYTPKGNNPLSIEFNKKQNETNSDYPVHQIKFHTMLLPRGAAVFSYEYNIKNRFSVLGLAGLNFQKDFVFMYMNVMPFMDKAPNENALSFSRIYTDYGRINGITPYLGGGVKVHIGSDIYDKYIQLDMASFKQNLLVSTTSLLFSPSNISDSSYPLTAKFFISTLKLSSTYVSSSDKLKFIQEFYLVVGLRFLTYETFELLSVDNTNNYYTYGVKEFKNTSFYLGMGYNIGIGFDKKSN